MKIADIIKNIEAIAPVRAQAEWDLSGLQVTSERTVARKMALCLDPLPERLAAALDAGADFILSHHPLSLAPKLPNKRNAWFEALKLLMTADVPLYAAHTSLDVNLAGPAGWLGRVLNLKDMRILEPTTPPDAIFPDGLGFGAIGELPEAESAADFLRRLARLLKLENIVLCGPELPQKLRRVAFCGGSGSSLCEAAAKAGADLFITGDMKYHAALESPVTVADVGHFSIENEMMRHMAELLRQRLEGIDVIFVDAHAPFRTFIA